MFSNVVDERVWRLTSWTLPCLEMEERFTALDTHGPQVDKCPRLVEELYQSLYFFYPLGVDQKAPGRSGPRVTWPPVLTRGQSSLVDPREGLGGTRPEESKAWAEGGKQRVKGGGGGEEDLEE